MTENILDKFDSHYAFAEEFSNDIHAVPELIETQSFRDDTNVRPSEAQSKGDHAEPADKDLHTAHQGPSFCVIVDGQQGRIQKQPIVARAPHSVSTNHNAHRQIN